MRISGLLTAPVQMNRFGEVSMFLNVRRFIALSVPVWKVRHLAFTSQMRIQGKNLSAESGDQNESLYPQRGLKRMPSPVIYQ
jgi:hypothetical protein